MKLRTNVQWEKPDGHQLRLPLQSSSYSTISKPNPDAAEVVYLFLDEAGNFDFSAHGTRYFIMTCVVTRRPLVLDKPLASLKYDFIEGGYSLEKFHASEDRDAVRTAVYQLIHSRFRTVAAYAALVDKNALPDEMKRKDILYSRVFELLTDEIYANEVSPNTKMVIVMTDSLPKEAKRKQVEKPLKEFMKRRFQENGIPYQLMHHQSCSCSYLQIADYLCWAVHRQYAQGHDWPMSKVAECFREIGQVNYSVVMEEGDPR